MKINNIYIRKEFTKLDWVKGIELVYFKEKDFLVGFSVFCDMLKIKNKKVFEQDYIEIAENKTKNQIFSTIDIYIKNNY